MIKYELFMNMRFSIAARGFFELGDDASQPVQQLSISSAPSWECEKCGETNKVHRVIKTPVGRSC